MLARIQVIQATGHLGDWKSVGGGIAELKFSFGPGYRIYFCRQGDRVMILLGGGDKDSQHRDIAHAKTLAQELED